MIDFPANPTVGQQFTAAGVTWTWDGVKWLPSGLSPTVVPGINDNRIINGDMRIDQHNNGAVGTATDVYTADRWQYVATQAAKGQWQRGSGFLASFPYYLLFNSTSAYTSLATDYFAFRQMIEADQISDFQWGTANAQPVTLSFWVSTSGGVTGTFSGSITNYAGTRSYPFTYTIPVVNVATRIVITIPGDTAGTWVMSGNGGSVIVYFDLGCGSNYRGPANAWASAGYFGVTGSQSIVAANNMGFYFTGVKLETGSVATPYNRQSLAKSMVDCQRYYQVGQVMQSLGGNSWQVGWTTQANVPFPVLMRAVPTIVTSAVSEMNCSGTACAPQTPFGLVHQFSISAATGGASSTATWTASAEF